MFIGIGIRKGKFVRISSAGGPSLRRLRGDLMQSSDFEGFLTTEDMVGAISQSGVISASLSTDVILTAGRSPSGYIGYSSFEDDAFGELTFPKAIIHEPDKPMLALMSLPGGGDYIVFDKDARSELAGQKVVLGETEAVISRADAFQYNTNVERTQIIYLDSQFTIVEGQKYPVHVEEYVGIPQELEALIEQAAELEASLAISHNLAAVIEQNNQTIGHLYPPITLRGSFEQQSNFDAKIQVIQRLRGSLVQTGLVEGDLFQNNFRRLNATLIQTQTHTADLWTATAQRLVGNINQTQNYSGIIEEPVPVEYEAEATALWASMTIQPTEQRKVYDNTLIKGLKDAGIWEKLDALFVYDRPEVSQANINWKNPADNASDAGSSNVTHIADEGYVAGTGGFLNSGFNPASGTWNFKAADACAFGYCPQTTPTVNGAFFGANINTIYTFLAVFADGRLSGALNSVASEILTIPSATVPDRKGLVSICRSASNSLKMYHRGGVVGQRTNAATLTLGSGPHVQLAYRTNTGSIVSPRGDLTPVVGWGASLTDAQNADLSDLIEDYIATIAIPSTPIEFVAQSDLIGSTGSVTLSIPPEAEVGDTLILIATSARQNITVPPLFTDVTGGTSGTTTGDYDQLRVAYYSRVLEPGFESAITINDTGEETFGKLLVFRNVRGVGAAGASSGGTTSSTTANFPAITTLLDNEICLWTIVYGKGDQISTTFSNVDADVTGFQEIFDHQTLIDSFRRVGMASAIGLVSAPSIVSGPTATTAAATTYRLATVLRLYP